MVVKGKGLPLLVDAFESSHLLVQRVQGALSGQEVVVRGHGHH